MQAQRTQHATQLSERTKTCEAFSTGLSKTLNSLRNQCVELDKSIAAELEKAGLVEQEAALRKDLKQTRSLKSGQALRLKEHARIVPMQSRSFIKQLLGIGQAKRDAQAAALGERHGLPAHAVTRKLLKDTLSGIQAKKDAIRDDVLQSHSDELHATFLTAAKLATLESRDLDSLHTYATRAVGRLQLQSTFVDSFKCERDDLHATQRKASDQWLRPLQERQQTLDVQLRTLAQQEKRAARSALLASAGVNDVGATHQLQQKLKELQDKCEFNAVYHTNAGCNAIQELVEGRRVTVSPSAIIDEIQRMHGDDTFGRGAAKGKAALKAGAAQLTESVVNQINDTCHALALAEFRDGTRDIVTTYRQAPLSESRVADLRDMAGTNGLLRPTRFLSTSDNKKEILAYPVDRDERLHCVRVTIVGFSAMKTGSPWQVSGEGQVRLYSTHSCFRVESVRKEAEGIWQVKLREQPVNADHRLASLLRL